MIVQNFLPKPGTSMHAFPPCPPDEFLWTIAAARLVLPAEIHLQAPPNLSDDLGPLLDSGIDDWGGVSPVTADHVNPERAWPALEHPAGCHRGGRVHPGAPPHHLPRVRPRSRAVARPAHAVPGARPRRRRGAGPRPPWCSGGEYAAASVARRSPRVPSPPVATAPARRRPVGEVLAGVGLGPGGGRGRDRRPCSPPGDPRCGRSPRWPTRCGARSSATR